MPRENRRGSRGDREEDRVQLRKMKIKGEKGKVLYIEGAGGA